MNVSRCALFALAASVFSFLGVHPASAQNLSKAWVTEAARHLIENRVADGLSIGFIEGDHFGIVHLGAANEKGETADYNTVYEIGSITKVFTGLLLADAAVRGEIKLDAPAEVDNPAGIRLPSRDGRAIHWIDLSTHRSGLPRLATNMTRTDMLDPYRDYDSKKAAEFLDQYELPRAPGKSQEYSNFGASILGYLVAAKTSKSYDELLRERIAGPLEMIDCTVSLSSDQEKRLATPHADFGTITRPWRFADLPGAGGVHATMRDMMRFAKAQLSPPRGQIGDAIELAWKQHTEADDSGPAMGLGWMIAGDGQTRWHNGRTGGYTSALFINRQLQCAVIVLANTSVPNKIDELAMQLVLKAAGQEVKNDANDAKADPVTDKLPIDAALRRRLVGRYQLAPNFIFTVRDRDGHLMVSITDQPTQEVFPDSPTRWSYRGVAATLEFKLPKTGRARSLVLHQNGMEQTARRIN